MVQDLRYALRMIRQHPWFSAAIIGTLALGIGTNTTVFTLVNAVLFKPLPFPGGERIVMVSATNPGQNRNFVNVSYPDFRDFRQESSSFQSLEAINTFPVNLSESGNPPERYRGARVTSGLFQMLGMQPVIGRTFGAADEKAGAESVMILGYGVWSDRYGKDPKVIGRTVRENEKPVVIVGVMPEGFKFPNNEDLWLNVVPGEGWEKRDNRAFMLVGMMKPGQTTVSARSELDVIAKRLEQRFPDTHKGHGVAVRTFHEAMNGGPIRTMFLLMLGAVGFVLLIACANVANMLLGRALSRRREISIRIAMGASSGRVLRQLLVESVLLSVLGGLIGLALSTGAVQAFSNAVQNVGKPYWITFEMNYVVFGYFAAVCIFAGILFGFVPALQAARVDINGSLKEGSKGSSGGRGTGLVSAGLVVFQFTLAVILLSASGLMIRSFLMAKEEFANVQSEQILHARVGLPDDRYKTPESRRAFFETLLPRLNAVPGAESVSMVSSPPGSGSADNRFEIAGQPVVEFEKRPIANAIVAAPGYYQLLGMPLIQGRDFNFTDGLPGKEAMLVSREFAAKHFAGTDPIGRQIRFFNAKKEPRPWMTIIGITPDVRQGDPSRPDQGAVVVLPYNFESYSGMALMVRTRGDAAALTAALRSEVQQVDGLLPLFDVGRLQQNFERNRWHLRVFGTVFFIFAIVALGMASVGIYAVLAHATTQRTREIGVRMALGAQSGSILRMVLTRGVVQIGLGMAFGLTAAFFVCRLMSGILLKVSPSDPLTFGVVSVTLVSAGLAACFIPARRAARLDPLQALRED
jgi:putative ABC transport system permease protein